MCYNCRCCNPDDDMGDSRNITRATFAQLAKSHNTSTEAIEVVIIRYLEEGGALDPEMEQTFVDAAKAWGQSVAEAKARTLTLLKQMHKN